MAYDGGGLYARIKERLESAPATRLLDFACELKVSRRTVERCVRAATGQSFRDLKRQILSRRIEEALILSPNLSIKEVSVLFGYASPRSLSRFLSMAGNGSPINLRRSRVAHTSRFS